MFFSMHEISLYAWHTKPIVCSEVRFTVEWVHEQHKNVPKTMKHAQRENIRLSALTTVQAGSVFAPASNNNKNQLCINR